MKYQIVVYTQEGFDVLHLDENNIIPACEVRGWKFAGMSNNPRHRAELQGQPKFTGLCGPMWNGDGIRYETPAAYDRLSA